MNQRQSKQSSKFLSLVLRHQPETIGLQLDDSGWADVEELITSVNQHHNNISLTTESLAKIVEANDKQRFEFNASKSQIRARQGHSVQVELGYSPAVPPEFLLHGTPESSLIPIREHGLKKMARHHVHLHADHSIASAVGQRRGTPVLLKVRAKAMHADGFIFYVTENQVWLTDHVPVDYIEFPK